MGVKSTNDKFYTNPIIVDKLLDCLNLMKYDLIIEPSAGNGSFSNKIIKNKNNLISLDIEPEDSYIQKQNWFDYKVPVEYKKVLILGNPPFGINNKLSMDFIKHSLSFDNVTTIAFILPNVFNKHTKQKIFPQEWKLVRVIELPKNSFLLNNEEYHVPCSFYIWTKEFSITDLRFDFEKYQYHNDFNIIKNKNDFNKSDFFVMGSNPANVLKVREVNKNNRGYYIKVNGNISEVINNFRNIKWNEVGNSSASGGVSWFSQPELIYFYDKYKKV